MFLFSTTASLDFVFKGLKAEDADDVHVMVVGMEGGGIHLSIYDSFVIGTFRLKDMVMADPATNLELCGHSSRPEIPTHMLLFKPQDGRALGLVPMDLTFVHHSPVNLSLLASKVTMLQNLLRYVKQTQAHMATEWKGTRELPSRFLLGVQDDLAKWSENERGTRELTIIQALYHTVMTGHVFPPVKEWLLDVVAERGHKRWEKAVLNGLLNLRSLVHENFIPALERCGVILSRLLGLARFHESNKNIGFTAAEISKLMDIVACLMVVAHKVVLNVMTELEYFTAFSIWLRMEIDKQSSSSQSDELTEKEATMDNAKVLSYIQRYLVTSPLATYFDEGADENYAKGEELAEEGPSLLQLLDKEMQKQEAGQEYMKTLPHVDFLIKYLNKKAGNVFLNIAAAQKRGVRFGRVTTISLQDNKIWKQDVLLCAPNDALGETNIAVVAEKDKSIIFLFRTSFKITNGISGIPSTRAVMIKLPRGTTIIDFGFLSGKSLLALCHINDEPKYILLRIAYHRIQYEAYADGAGMRIVDFTDEEPLEAPFFGRYGLSNMSGFTPVRMEVLRGNALRGETPPRVCLVGRDRSVYKTYKLPKGWDSDGSSENREEEEEEEEEE
ncbi:anaphase-promoting complex, cyclosome, subunit 4-domain-containing protein [Cladorrhinum sp. PSN259]|nr:anaphase-promoting complex, cyclosome, subunit 4-domain-containing protein [Cladorrhinum sp. PSN259]